MFVSGFQSLQELKFARFIRLKKVTTFTCLKNLWKIFWISRH